MGIRSSTHRAGDSNAMVNRHLGEAYKDVKLVADNIENLEALGEALPYLESYLGVYANAPTQRKDGSPIQNGDFYFDSGSETMQYAFINESDVLTWHFVDPALFVDLLNQAEAARDAALAAQASAEHAVVLASEEVVKAQAEVGRAIDQVNLAKAEVTKAESHATAASGSADAAAAKVSLAQAEVDKAALEVGKAQNEVANAQAEVAKAAQEKQAAEIHANSSRTQADRAQSIADSMAGAEDDLNEVKDQAIIEVAAATNNSINVIRTEGFDQRDQVASVGASQQEMISSHADTKMTEITTVANNQINRVIDATAESETRLIEAVQGADSATAAAINEIEQAGATAEASIETKANEEKESLSGFAQEEVQRATQEANRAESAADDAQSKVSEAAFEANRARSEADRASAITGLDTVEDAIAMEMQNHNPYGAMLKSERDALREQRIREGDGSGFKEWGRNSNVTEDVNQGIGCHPSYPDYYTMGRADTDRADEGNPYPIVHAEGSELHIVGVAWEPERYGRHNHVMFPAAPNGTKTFDGSEVRKYEDKPGIGELYDAMGVDFNRDTYVKIPSFSLSAGSSIEATFKLNDKNSQYYLFSGFNGSHPYFYYSNADDRFLSGGLNDLTVNGIPIGEFGTPQVGVEYKLSATLPTAESIDTVGAHDNTNAKFSGQIWDLKLTDVDTGETRHYLPMQHHKVADGELVQSKVENVAAYNPREGYVVNYDVDEGYVLVPTFPLMDAMNISMALRTTSNDRQEFGQEVVGSRMRFLHDPENQTGFLMSFGNATLIKFDTHLQIGKTHYLDVQLRSNGDTTYRLDATLDGEHALSYDNIYFDLNEFGSFCLGAYSGGAGSHWQGQIYDFEIQYPDAPHLNRNYMGFDSEDPEGRLFIRDENGFSEEDWGVSYTGTAQGHIHLPEPWKPTGLESGENTISFLFKWDGASGASQTLHYLVCSAVSGSPRVYVTRDTGAVTVNSVAEATINGEPANGFVLQEGDIYKFQARWSHVYGLANIGGYWNGGNNWNGNIWDVRLNDLLNPANSRHYPLVINSATQPANDAPIVDKLYDEDTAPFYTPDATAGGYVDVPTMVFPVVNQDFSMEADVFVGAPGGDHLYITYWDGTSNPDVESQNTLMIHNDSTVRWYWAGAHRLASPVLSGQHHVRVTVVDTLAEMFIDGVSVGTYSHGGMDNGDKHIDNVLKSSGVANHKAWNISLVDNNDSTNSRFYPSIIYSPDSVPTATVLEQTLVNYEFNNDLLAESWRNGNGSAIDVTGDIFTFTQAVSSGVYLRTPLALYGDGSPVTVEYSITVTGDDGNTVIQLRDGFNGASVPAIDIGTGNGTYTGTWEFVAFDDGAFPIGDIYLRCQGAEIGTTVQVNTFRVRANDGTFVNFPSGSVWKLAQVSGLTEGTPKGFTGSVWNNDLPDTDAPMTQFTTPWVEYSTALHGEVVGNSTWAGLSLQASQKAFDYASGSDAEVIISRKDLSFIEVWDEKVSDKGILFPFGNTQYGGNSWEGIYTGPATNFGVAQGYSAFGEWDEDTVGRPLYKTVDELSEAELKKFHSDPRNNTWWDPETGEYWQTRYRIRTVEGLGDDWRQTHPDLDGISDGAYNGTIRYQSSPMLAVSPQGSSESTISFVKDYSLGFAGKSNSNADAHVGLARTTISRLGNDYKYVPLTLTQRLNQGAVHPVWNPNGTRCSNHTNTTRNRKWYEASLAPQSPAECFYILNAVNTTTRGAIFESGNIQYANTGSSTQYEHYDAIYAGQVEDLRLSCNRHETSKLLEDSIRKAVRGELRGKGKVPFTYIGEIMEGSSNNTVFTKLLDKFPWPVNYKMPASYLEYAVEMPDGTYETIDFPNIWAQVRENESPGAGYMKLQTNNANLSTHPNVGAKVVVTAYIDSLATEFDSLPWVDIIGDPERIAATFPDGVVGMWIPKLPTGSTTPYELGKKVNATTLFSVYTADDGVTWTTGSINIDQVTNTRNSNLATNSVTLNFYEALSDFTEAADNSKVVGKVGDVFTTSSSWVDAGNRLHPSLTGEIGKDDDSTARNFIHTKSYVFTGADELNEAVVPTHGEIDISTQNDSHAVKALYTLTEKDGLTYLQFHGSELVYGGDSNANSAISVDQDADTDYVKGSIYKFTNAAAEFRRKIVRCEVSGNYRPAYTMWEGDNGHLYSGAGTLVFTAISPNGNWGDNSEIPVVDGESTQTDLNGTTVKTFCHHTMFPIGIASNK